MSLRRVAVALAVAGAALAGGVARADAPPPSITVTCSLSGSPLPGTCADWFPGDVSVVWTVVPPVNTDCPASRQVSAEGLTPIPCTATIGPTTFGAGVTVKIDRTPPTATGASVRAPDANGWYTHPVTVAFTGTDALSGIASCTTTTYSGPDAAGATVTGTCTDRAGLTSVPLAFSFDYDATPPSLALQAEPASRLAQLRWSAVDATQVEVARTPGRGRATRSVLYRGHGSSFADRDLANGRTYSYSVTATDRAGNAVTRTIAVRPGTRLLGPGSGSRVGAPPLLRWTRVAQARYYNVQLFRVVGGRLRKVRSSWPTKPRLQLVSRWRYRGVARRLVPGRYRWYVWPGRGPRSAQAYGPVVGRASFTIVG
jgi:hypothetical protein